MAPIIIYLIKNLNGRFVRKIKISKLSLPKHLFPTLIFASSIGVPFSAFVTAKLSEHAIFPGTS